ncbi:MAG: hypothetical protein DME21_01170 [Verrucomicrobia bacterium]|nr:MAG: hypothetical protein DME21_01170 [Verrucomicrobiota bacterium]
MKRADALLVALRNGPPGFEGLAKFILKMGGKSLMMVFIWLEILWQEQERNQVGTAPAPGASDRCLAGGHQSAARSPNGEPGATLAKVVREGANHGARGGRVPIQPNRYAWANAEVGIE